VRKSNLNILILALLLATILNFDIANANVLSVNLVKDKTIVNLKFPEFDTLRIKVNKKAFYFLNAISNPSKNNTIHVRCDFLNSNLETASWPINLLQDPIDYVPLGFLNPGDYYLKCTPDTINEKGNISFTFQVAPAIMSKNEMKFNLEKFDLKVISLSGDADQVIFINGIINSGRRSSDIYGDCALYAGINKVKERNSEIPSDWGGNRLIFSKMYLISEPRTFYLACFNSGEKVPVDLQFLNSKNIIPGVTNKLVVKPFGFGVGLFNSNLTTVKNISVKNIAKQITDNSYGNCGIYSGTPEVYDNKPWAIKYVKKMQSSEVIKLEAEKTDYFLVCSNSSKLGVTLQIDGLEDLKQLRN